MLTHFPCNLFSCPVLYDSTLVDPCYHIDVNPACSPNLAHGYLETVHCPLVQSSGQFRESGLRRLQQGDQRGRWPHQSATTNWM